MRFILLATAIACFAPACASAQDNADPGTATEGTAVLDGLNKTGVKVDQQINQKGCIVTIKIDQQAFIEAIPALQRAGVMNPDLTQTTINMMPDGLAMAYAIQTAPTVVKIVFETNPTVKTCSFKQVVESADDYGNPKERPVFTFDFTRAIYDKVNWEKFEVGKLRKIAPHFRLDPGYMAAVEKEQTKD